MASFVYTRLYNFLHLIQSYRCCNFSFEGIGGQLEDDDQACVGNDKVRPEAIRGLQYQSSD
jgi:hypothetical protein